jgi:predicted DNA-binding ribbon-helix-helix protein
MPTTRQPQHATSATGSSLVTRNLRLGRGRTSIRLERMEWAALDAICLAENIDRHLFAAQVDRDPLRREKTLTSRVRSAILAYFVARSGLSLPPNAVGREALLNLGISPAPAPAKQEESRN